MAKLKNETVETQAPVAENTAPVADAAQPEVQAQAPEETAAPKVETQAPVAKKSTSRNTVYVFANLPHGQSFMLPNGKTVTLNGYPVSQLVGPDGEVLPSGRFGVTEVPVDEWDAIEKLYGEMVVMKSGLIFSAASMDRGEVMAAEREALRHGLEQIDPRNSATTPKD